MNDGQVPQVLLSLSLVVTNMASSFTEMACP